jgi:hypothetical protein
MDIRLVNPRETSFFPFALDASIQFLWTSMRFHDIVHLDILHISRHLEGGNQFSKNCALI